jgi:type IV pilus assembly protein PilX
MIMRGIVLITAILLLLILTIIGITAMNSTALTERMTQNLRDSSTAFESSESGLGNGEERINSLTAPPTPVSTCGAPPCTVWVEGILGNFYTQPDSWWESQGTKYSSTISNVAVQPYYIVEQYGFVPYELSPDAESKGQGYYMYRITARGTGLTDNSHAILQSIYITQFN